MPVNNTKKIDRGTINGDYLHAGNSHDDDNDYDRYSKTISMLPQGGEEEMHDNSPIPLVVKAPRVDPSVMQTINHEYDDMFKSSTDPEHQPAYRPGGVFTHSHFYRQQPQRKLPPKVEEKKGWFSSLFSNSDK